MHVPNARRASPLLSNIIMLNMTYTEALACLITTSRSHLVHALFLKLMEGNH